MADNPDEIFDVVDRQDRVVGQARRADVHERGLLHRAVHILIQGEDRAVFLQRRSLEKDAHPGKWDSSSSGHLDTGEAYASAAMRELREELGCSADLLEIGRLPASEITGQEFVRIYKAEHPGPFDLHPDEILEGGWYAPQQIDEWTTRSPEEFAPCFVAVWHSVRDAFRD
jgi:isopentenyldiphosphate isomerase